MMRTGIVGWRGMVGSVLMERMRDERDFELIEPVFFDVERGRQGARYRPRHLAAGRTPTTSRRCEARRHHFVSGWRLHHRGLSEAAGGRLERLLDRRRLDAAHEGRCRDHPRSGEPRRDRRRGWPRACATTSAATAPSA